MNSILVTGAAGFIGYQTVRKLLAEGHSVIGIDDLNDHYDVRLKQYRLDDLLKTDGFSFSHCSITDRNALSAVFDDYSIGGIINLAARPGVRYSIENPQVYIDTNVSGTLNLLHCCAEHGIPKLVLASTSSLYAGQKMPFTEDLPVNEPVSPYAASKKAAEALAYTYHHLYGLDITVLRYFTVYGPAGRPDMSYFRFIRWIDEGSEILVYGDGSQKRDFTYVEDIAEGTVRALEVKNGYEIINLGGNKTHELNELVGLIETYCGKKARRKELPFHRADMTATWADITKAGRILGWKPRVSLTEGIKRTVEWYYANKSWAADIDLDLSK